MTYKSLAGATLALLLPFTALAAQSATPDWVAQSNAHAQVLLKVLADFNPETAGQLGVEGYDDKIIDLKPKNHQRSQQAAAAAVAELQARLAKEEHPAVRQDLQILIKAARDNMESAQLNHELALPYIAVDRLVFGGIKGLLDPRISPERQALAVTRLQRYAGLDGGTPVTALARARTEERFFDASLIGPYRAEIEQNLSETEQVLTGLKSLFEASALEGWEQGYEVFAKQVRQYNQWLKSSLLPKARDDHRLPPALYADNLKQFGLSIEPQELMQKALVSFAEIRNEMRAVAAQLAAERGYKSKDYRDVIRTLKQQQIANPEILPTYQARLAKLEEILRKQDIVSVPERDAVIRLASEAESAILPAPHMSPPRLIGNTGEYGEFVLPLNVPAAPGKQALKMDDFTFDAATWTLTVHEARMGHEMQFAAMVENGVSIARAVFAFNSVNVEGWALYAEAEMKPDLPLDGQLISLQHRLMRACRAFMDLMLNLGMVEPEAANEFLMTEVVLSEAMAKQEVDRYTFRAPGQATSYFFGYQRLMEVRQRAELALGDKFKRKAFHDFVLAQGLIPPELLEKAVMEQFVPSQL